MGTWQGSSPRAGSGTGLSELKISTAPEFDRLVLALHLLYLAMRVTSTSLPSLPLQAPGRRVMSRGDTLKYLGIIQVILLGAMGDGSGEFLRGIQQSFDFIVESY